MIYLDYAASTPIGVAALKKLCESMEEDFANPSSSHKLGRILNKELHFIKKEFISLLDAPINTKEDQFIFTSSATESNNIIIKGLKLSQDDEVLYSGADHPSVVSPVKSLEDQKIKINEYCLNESGEILIDKLIEQISTKTKLIIITKVNNQSGNLHNIELLSKKIREKSQKVHIHIDASQSFLKHSFSIKKSLVNSVAISGHKVFAPIGIAGLYIDNPQKLTPLLFGGGQENNLRPSTVSLPLIKSFRAAVFEDARINYSELHHVSKLNLFLREGLLKIEPKIEFPFKFESTSHYILTFILPSISSDIILRHLEEKEIYLSSTSACSSRKKGFNSVFHSLNIDNKKHKWVLRLSLCSLSTKDDVEQFLKNFEQIYADIKQFLR